MHEASGTSNVAIHGHEFPQVEVPIPLCRKIIGDLLPHGGKPVPVGKQLDQSIDDGLTLAGRDQYPIATRRDDFAVGIDIRSDDVYATMQAFEDR